MLIHRLGRVAAASRRPLIQISELNLRAGRGALPQWGNVRLAVEGNGRAPEVKVTSVKLFAKGSKKPLAQLDPDQPYRGLDGLTRTVRSAMENLGPDGRYPSPSETYLLQLTRLLSPFELEAGKAYRLELEALVDGARMKVQRSATASEHPRATP